MQINVNASELLDELDYELRVRVLKYIEDYVSEDVDDVVNSSEFEEAVEAIVNNIVKEQHRQIDYLQEIVDAQQAQIDNLSNMLFRIFNQSILNEPSTPMSYVTKDGLLRMTKALQNHLGLPDGGGVVILPETSDENLTTLRVMSNDAYLSELQLCGCDNDCVCSRSNQ